MIGSVRIGTASRPYPGETLSGDQLVVVESETAVTIALADGLGHGPDAAHAALHAVDVIRSNSDLDLAELVRLADLRLRGTRGVALTLLRIDNGGSRLVHVAIGNVELVARTKTAFAGMPVPGVVGSRVRKIAVSEMPLAIGDLLVLYTDGIARNVSLDSFIQLDPQAAADAILRDYGRTTDDAACVVIRV